MKIILVRHGETEGNLPLLKEGKIMEPQYNPSKIEKDIYKLWEQSGFFNPDNLPPFAKASGGKPGERKKSYCIIMPPPNANAPSHVGHALGYTIQDILIRYNRMRGKKTLWLPGSDHAGFETQVVFEKKLEKEGRSRFKMQREEFYKEIRDYVQTNKHISEEAIRRLGASCDWSRNIFTLDPEIIKIVYQTFKQMYDDGLVYRGDRLGNWCSKHQTALSDLETKYEERAEPFYYLKYGPFTIGTSRPETKFGDKYVVMHPADERYQKYNHGDKIELEWINGPVVATVIKDEAADMEFGTGVMTITPWHDPVDFEIAQRHDLEKEQVIDKSGRLLPVAGEFSGMKIAVARPVIIEKLKAKGLLEKIDENYKHNVQVCYKCNTVIEPQIIPQWFVKMTEPLKDGRPSLRDMALLALDKGEVKIITEKFEKIFRHWMENIRDWPISRQIWWGISIPVKYCGDCGEVMVDIDNNLTGCAKCQSKNLIQDPDTFDTWFSSGQWPYATMMANDAKHGTDTFENFYPTQTMETAWDILFFWVARMIMFSYYRTDKPPFENVFLHGLVRDKDRKKMSKSKGNVIDPLGVIDAYGSDALRMALVFGSASDTDLAFGEDKIVAQKKFANKIWNAARFSLANLDEDFDPKKIKPKFTAEDKWIIDELNKTAKKITVDLENYKFHEAAATVYHFFWHSFCDKCIEDAKKRIADPISEIDKKTAQYVIWRVLKESLILLHPFMPFITEAIYQQLPGREGEMLMIASWPEK